MTTPSARWHLPDKLWNMIRGLLPAEKPPSTVGRGSFPLRVILEGVLYVLRTGAQWKAMPRQFGSGSTVHRRRRCKRGPQVFNGKNSYLHLIARAASLGEAQVTRDAAEASLSRWAGKQQLACGGPWRRWAARSQCAARVVRCSIEMEGTDQEAPRGCLKEIRNGIGYIAADNFDSAVDRCDSKLAVQPGMGLWSQRHNRAGAGRVTDPDFVGYDLVARGT
jgi:transposase